MRSAGEVASAHRSLKQGIADQQAAPQCRQTLPGEWPGVWITSNSTTVEDERRPLLEQ